MTSHNLRMKSKRRQWRRRAKRQPAGPLADLMAWAEEYRKGPPKPPATDRYMSATEYQRRLDVPDLPEYVKSELAWSRVDDTTPIADMRKAAENPVVASTPYALPPDFPTTESENE